MCPHFRDDEVCKQVPVVRLVPQCQDQERVLCEAVPYQQQIQRCELTNSPVCATQVSEALAVAALRQYIQYT